MKVLVVALLMAAAATGAAARHLEADEYEAKFDTFVSRFDKTYASADERAAAFAIFMDNWDRVIELNEQHVNAGGEANVFGFSPFLDMHPDDFKSRHNFQLPAPEDRPQLPVFNATAYRLRGAAPLASSDWRQKGAVSPVKDQGQCGSCWAFSTTETVESANAVAGKGMHILAPQQVVDCDTTDSACNGGIPKQGLAYVSSAGGMMSESDYPYTSGSTQQPGQCQFDASKVVETIGDFESVSADEGSMVSAMDQNGPLSICIDASTWQYYQGGVLSNCGTQIDHAVQAVGYDTSSTVQVTGWWDDDGKKTDDKTDDSKPSSGGYWIVKNSWGASWGESGYIRLSYGSNTCGITSNVVYAKA